MGGVPVLRGNLSSGDFGEPLGPACIGARGLLLMGAAGGDRVPGGFQREPGLSWASQPAAAATTTTARPEWGSPVFASVCAFARSLEAAGWGDPSAALVPAAPAARNSCFLFEKQAKAKKKKDFQTCLGRDQMPNGLDPSHTPSCYLSRPVVWGRTSLGSPPPPDGAGWGAGPLHCCPPLWRRREGSRGQDGMQDPGPRG